MKHTPGQWRAAATDIVDDEGTMIASAAYNPRKRANSSEQMIPNATLIASSPDLLEACRQALARIEHLNIGTEELGEDPTVIVLRKAIAKAEGRQ